MDQNPNTPSLREKSSPKDVFLHLLAIISLYVSAGSFVALLFQYINISFPDLLQQGDYYLRSAYSSIRWAIATLIVVFPVYIFTNWLLGKDYAKNPSHRDLRVRKWLIYLTLFAAALFIIGDLIALIYNFLEGELTVRFFLKIAVVFLVAGAIFWYYLMDIRKERIS